MLALFKKALLFLSLIISSACFALDEPPKSFTNPQQSENNSRQDNGPNYTKTQHGPPKSDGERLAIIWDRTFDDPVAFFTFVLSCFTLALVIVSAIQIRFLIRGDKTARITAEAADLSAQAAIGIELPRLFSSVKVNRVNDSLWSVVISVTNYGRTPALVTHQSADISHEPLPSTPQYNAIIDVGPGTIIPKDGVRDLVARDNNSLSVFTDESIRPNTFFWVYGIILYRDFINKKHGAKFCYRFVSLNESGSGFMIVPEGPEAYTESY